MSDKQSQVTPSVGPKAHVAHARRTAARQLSINHLQQAGNQAFGRLLAPCTIQAKLVITPPADCHESEADHAADTVLRMPSGAPPVAPSLSRISRAPVQRQCPDCDEKLQRKCAKCQEDEMQRKAAQGAVPGPVSPSVERSIVGARGGGHPLPTTLRRQFEPRFGADLSGVRLHTDTNAAKLADSVGAHAFTTGKDIFFASGRYRPDSRDSRRLLAHELAHTIQQEGFDRPTIQREEAKEAPPPDVELGVLDRALIETVAAPAAALGGTAHGLAKATVTGFVKEVRLEAPTKSAEFKKQVDEKLTARGIGSFILHYWWGLIKGIFSPITGLIDLVKLGTKLQELQFQVLATTWTRRDELAADALQIAVQMNALGDRVQKFLSGLKEHPLDTVKALAGWFSSLGGKALEAAESGGRKAAKLLMSQLDKPLDELGEIAGEIIGTVLINIVLLVFTEGIGNAIAQIGSKLGELGSFLGKFGKAAEALAGLATKLGEFLEVIGGWIGKAEQAIAKIAESVLKPIGPVLEEFGKVVSGLRSFLRKLLGVSEEATAGALEQAAGGAARTLEHAPPAAPPKVTPKVAPKPTVTEPPPPALKPAVKPAPKPTVTELPAPAAAPKLAAQPAPAPAAAAPESKLFQGVSDETETLLARRPGLKKVLSEHPQAADLFKLCKSECFPSFMTDEEIAERLVRLEKIEAEARRLGTPLDRAKTKELLHAQKDTAGVDSALSDIEKQTFGPAKPGAPAKPAATGGQPAPEPEVEAPGPAKETKASGTSAQEAAWTNRAETIRAKGTNLSQQEAEELQSLRQKLGESEGDLIADTPDHKAQRWKDYKDRKGPKKFDNYDDWSKSYDTAMKNPKIGLQREAEYRTSLGGENKLVKTPDGNRQCDVFIGEPPNVRVYQIKTGREYLTKTGRLANELAIKRDAYLVKVLNYKITWVLEEGGSPNLLEALEKAGIKYVETALIP